MSNIKLFESRKIRSEWNEIEQQWNFSIIDIIEILTGNTKPTINLGFSAIFVQWQGRNKILSGK